jgi:serine/threonine protein kinase
LTLPAGTRLGPYEVVSPLGAGGMGEVYRGRDTRLERAVAIKVLAAHLTNSPGLRERFDREAKAISRRTAASSSSRGPRFARRRASTSGR